MGHNDSPNVHIVHIVLTLINVCFRCSDGMDRHRQEWLDYACSEEVLLQVKNEYLLICHYVETHASMMLYMDRAKMQPVRITPGVTAPLVRLSHQRSRM